MNMHLSRAAWAVNCEVDPGTFNDLFAAGGADRVTAMALLSAASDLAGAEAVQDGIEQATEEVAELAGEAVAGEAVVIVAEYEVRRAAAIEVLTALKPALVEAKVFKEIA